jgi:hypothetical protein
MDSGVVAVGSVEEAAVGVLGPTVWTAAGARLVHPANCAAATSASSGASSLAPLDDLVPARK